MKQSNETTLFHSIRMLNESLNIRLMQLRRLEAKGVPAGLVIDLRGELLYNFRKESSNATWHYLNGTLQDFRPHWEELDARFDRIDATEFVVGGARV